MERVLVVDDEEGIRTFIASVLEGEGFDVTQATDGEKALALLSRRSFHAMITDLKMPRLSGMDLFRRAREEQPEMEVVIITAHGSIQTAVEAMKLGAFDYLTKPLSGPDELRLVVSRALERRRLRDDRGRHRGGEEVSLVARDPAMQSIVAQLAKVAPTTATVLIVGESGTGKEVVARTIHRMSDRKEGPFVPVNCAALTESLLESELFGHEKGAFTGALTQRRGRFELADGGTLFLDEVAEIRGDLQAKLLRVIQERSFERVGGSRSIAVDVRLVAATNRDLSQEMAAGRFREDLYHRLAVFPIRIPPLKERPQDLQALTDHLLKRIGAQLGKPNLVLDEATVTALVGYSWPGNVRELANVLERASILAPGNRITPDLLHLLPPQPTAAMPWDGTLEELEREAIRRALGATGGHRKNAADRLGIGLRTLYEKIKAYGM